MPSHKLILLCKGKTTKSNTGQHYNNSVLIGSTNRSRFIIKNGKHVTISNEVSLICTALYTEVLEN